MPARYPRGIALLVSFTLCLILVVLEMPTPASDSVVAGIVDQAGEFVPKLLIGKTPASIEVKKIKGDEQFDQVKVRLLIPRGGQVRAMRQLSIQWERAPGEMGRRWPMETHRGFDPQSGTFAARWSEALSFVLRDRSNRNLFGEAPWHRVVQLWLDGKPVVLQPPPALDRPRANPVSDSEALSRQSSEPPVREDAPTTAGANDTVSQLSVAAQAPEPPPLPAPPPETIKTAVPGTAVATVDPAALKDLERKYDRALRRLEKLEHAVEESQKWFYWGPLLALTLAVLFSSVTVFLTYVRLSRGRGPGMPPPQQVGLTRFRPQGRFRDTG
ncbi:MAG: hypothetical protein FJ118_03555 [Deltaproteobacteria bacterium]|nr:hypothetical protein [Deltaproteobacteria bacterium]